MLKYISRLTVVALLMALVAPLPAGLGQAAAGACSVSLSESSVRPGSETYFSIQLENVSGPAVQWVQVTRPNADYRMVDFSLDGWGTDITDASGVATQGTLEPGDEVSLQLGVRSVIWQSAEANWVVRVSDSPDGSGAVNCTGPLTMSIEGGLPSEGEGERISNVTVEPSSTSAIVRWTSDSDAPMGSMVFYGQTSFYGKKTAYNATLVINHQVTITGLNPATGYHFQVAGMDEGGGPGYSGDNTFLTLPAGASGGSAAGGGGSTAVGSPAGVAPVASSGVAPRGTIAISAVPTETEPPTVTLLTSLAKPFVKDPAVSGTARDNVAVARVDYSLDGGQSWLVVPDPPGLGSTRVSFDFVAKNLEDGNYSLVLRATDTSGNAAMTAPAVMVVDREPPRIGGVLVAFGSQVAALDGSGRWPAAAGIDQTVTLNAVGGAVSITIAATRAGRDRAAQSFYLRRDTDNGLWTGLLSFGSAGTYHLRATAVDGAGNQTVRVLPDVAVKASARVVEAGSSQGVLDAAVTLYYRLPGQSQWLVWDGAAYGQANPQRVGASGTFAFLPPAGVYYLKAEAPGYRTLVTREFTVGESAPLTPVLQLTKRSQLRLGGWSWSWPGVTMAQTSIASDAQATPTVAPVLVGRGLPAFRLPTTKGDLVTPVSLQGKPTLVTVLATWAPPSAEQLPALAAVQARDGINVTPVYLGERSGKVQTTLAQAGYELPAVIDAHALLGEALGAPNLPTHYFVDRAGKVTGVYTGVLGTEALLARLDP